VRKRAAIIVAALASMCSARADAPSAPPAGLWIHHGEWAFAPKEFNENGDIHQNADAAVINLCPQGEFKMATGVIYQSTKSPYVMIGASDGLAIYSGRWTRDGSSIRVEYRVVSVEFEIPRKGEERERRPLLTGTLGAVRDRLRFPFITRSGTIHTMDFIPAARYEKIVEPEFVQCRMKPH
jgi:hypothetical protein